jgi:outer membrane protein assembly factor BamD (BamD/ComL family)
MGREPTGKGKYLLLYSACCIALLLGIWGCAHFPEKWKGEERLERAWTLFAKERYGASLRETEEVLRMYPRTLGDLALFQMGLIYAHPKNPDQDYRKSLSRFQRMIKEFPESKFRNQAEVWVFFVQEIMDKDWEINELKREGSHLGKALGKEEQKVKELESQTERLQAQVEKQKDQLLKLKDQLLRLKEIDLGIEEKRSQQQ